MLLSISLILIVGMFMGWLCQKCRLPSLLGMLATGMVLGPYVLNLLDGSILGISPELRKMALIIILTRAGLGLDTSGLKKLGRPAVLMCFVPASFELMGVLLLAPKLMGLTVLRRRSWVRCWRRSPRRWWCRGWSGSWTKATAESRAFRS